MANFNKSLSAQAAQLGRNLQSREKRRNTDRFRNNEIDDVYEDIPRKRPNSTGGVSLGPAAAALAAVSAASALPGPEIIRCNLCQATFTSKAQEQQHIAGPVHRKAVRKLEEEELKRQRMGVYSEVAQAALQAAAWQASQGQVLPAAASSAPGGPGNHSAPAWGQRNRQPDAQGTLTNAVRPNKVAEAAGARQGHGVEPLPGRGKRPGEQKANGQLNAERPQPMGLSHQQLVAQARGEQEPLSIGGWVPPSIPTVMTRRPSQSSQSASALPGSSQQLMHTSRQERTGMGPLRPASPQQQLDLHHRHGQPSGTQRDSQLEGAAEATATTAIAEQAAGVGTSGMGVDGNQEAPWGGLVDYSDDDEGVDSEQGEEEGGAPGQEAANDQHMLGIPAPGQGASDDSDTDEEDSESDGEPITSFF